MGYLSFRALLESKGWDLEATAREHLNIPSVSQERRNNREGEGEEPLHQQPEAPGMNRHNNHQVVQRRPGGINRTLVRKSKIEPFLRRMNNRSTFSFSTDRLGHLLSFPSRHSSILDCLRGVEGNLRHDGRRLRVSGGPDSHQAGKGRPAGGRQKVQGRLRSKVQ